MSVPPVPAVKPSNRLGKTALWVHLGGLIMASGMLGAAYCYRNSADEWVIFGGSGCIILVVMTVWSMVLAARGFWAGEGFTWLYFFLLFQGLELSSGAICAGYFSANSYGDTYDKPKFINQWAIPIWVPAILISTLVALWIARPKPNAERKLQPWKPRTFLLIFGCGALILLPYPLLCFAVQMHRAEWQIELGRKLFCTSPSLFKYFGDPGRFMAETIYREDSIASLFELVRVVAATDDPELKRETLYMLSRMSTEAPYTLKLYNLFSADPELTVRLRATQFVHYHNKEFQPIEHYPQDQLKLTIQRLHANLNVKDKDVRGTSAHVLCRLFNLPTNALPMLSRTGRTFLIGVAVSTPQQEQAIDNIREKTETWLKEHP